MDKPAAIPGTPALILGVAASDAHSVANRLIDLALTQAGYRVINLGPCTPVSDFAECFAAHPEALAVAIGSLNGHAVEDLAPLRAARDAGLLNCPVIVGGNVCVGERGRAASTAALLALGVDYVLEDLAELLALLGRLSTRRTPRAEPRPAPAAPPIPAPAT